MDPHSTAVNYVILDYVKEHVRNVMATNPEELVQDAKLLEIIKTLNVSRKNREDKSSKKPYCLITVNPRDDNQFEKFAACVKSSLKKKWISDYWYVFEQRGQTEECMGNGYHAHILLNREGKRPSEMKREFLSTFKNYIGNPKHVDFRFISDTDFDNTLNYLKGTKADPAKAAKTAIDVEWRLFNGLKAIYSWEDTLDERKKFREDNDGYETSSDTE